MANRRTQIQIPDPDPGDPSATPQQLQTIRQLVAGMSLQGYRFDYRKLTATQAHAVIQQLHAMTQAPNQSNTNPPKGPGCIASIAKTTTTLIVAAVVLVVVAAAAVLVVVVVAVVVAVAVVVVVAVVAVVVAAATVVVVVAAAAAVVVVAAV
ncbi:MAG: hypothetical protein ACPGYV_12375, partial [Phycisphaeraceae bacterium]